MHAVIEPQESYCNVSEKPIDGAIVIQQKDAAQVEYNGLCSVMLNNTVSHMHIPNVYMHSYSLTWNIL